MEDINNTTYFYRLKFKSKEAKFNKPGELPSYFGPMIGFKKEVKIAEIGAGPVNTIGDSWPGSNVYIYASDMFAEEYNKFWEHHKKTPLVPVEYQNMEHLTYPNEYFDIVHCVNALDHTKNPRKAILEMYRICQYEGWIYLRHAPNQRKRYRGMHYWDISFENGQCKFSNPEDHFFLPDMFESHLEGDLIVSICQKT